MLPTLLRSPFVFAILALLTFSSRADTVGATFESGWSGSGTFVDGQDVTVTKSAGGLGFPTDPRPILWIPGETGFDKDATYSRSSATITAQNNAAIDTTNKPKNAAGSIRQSWPIGAGDYAPTGCFFENEPLWTFSTDRVYVSAKRMHDFYPDQERGKATHHNDKAFRLWPKPEGAPDIYHLIRATSSPDNRAQLTIEGYSEADRGMSGGRHFFSINLKPNAFMQYEHVFKESKLDSFDGIVRLYVNGARAHPESIGWRTRSSSGEPGRGAKTQGYLDQLSNPAESGMNAGDKHINIAHIYINDQLRRFVISSESKWTQSTMNGRNDPGIVREVQLPRKGTGSDTSVGLHIRKGTYSSLSGLYLWFYPDDGGAPERVLKFD